jgi:hypothetical protein
MHLGQHIRQARGHRLIAKKQPPRHVRRSHVSTLQNNPNSVNHLGDNAARALYLTNKERAALGLPPKTTTITEVELSPPEIYVRRKSVRDTWARKVSEVQP